MTGWVKNCVTEMEDADNLDNTSKIYHLVKRLAGKPKPPEVNLNTDSSGKLLNSPEATAKVWENFLRAKFKPTDAEKARPPMPPIPEYRRPGAELTRPEFDAAIKKLKLSKATGPDGVPGEVFRACPQIADELFEILNYIWRH